MSEAVDNLTRVYLDRTFEQYPTAATSYGVHAFDDRLDELTEATLDAYVRSLRELRRKVLAIRPADQEEAVDRDALAAVLAEGIIIDEAERPWRRNPFEAATAVPNSLLGLIARDFAPQAERLENVAARLEAAPRFLEQAKTLLDEPCPALWRSMAVAAARGGVHFLSSTPRSLAVGSPLAGRIGAAAEQAADALEGFAAWLESEHAGRVPDASFAIGETAQTRKLHQVHCFDTSPAQFVQIGEAQLAQVSDALSEQAAKLGGADWIATLEGVKRRHPSREELLPAYRRELQKLEAFAVKHQLAIHPKAVVRIEATPRFLREVLGFAAYYPAGPFDPYQQGHFWVTPPRDDAGLRNHSYAWIPPVSAHEGYPGHHLQMTSVSRLKSLTRRALRSTVMIEGWGVYAEQLMSDTGYYDEEARLAQLTMRLLRALRIVLDMELQVGTLTFTEAVAKMVSISGLPEPAARAEVARYTMTPTQPFSYLIGCLELERLRDVSRSRLGNAFRLSDFHNRVLSYGHMPIRLVERAIIAADQVEKCCGPTSATALGTT